MRISSDFVREVDSAKLGVLIDSGHAAISREGLLEAAVSSRGRIAHVHLNNNDGCRDLHWPPQRGKLTRRDFSEFMRELERQGYRGRISVELTKPGRIARALVSSRLFFDDLIDGGQS